MQRLHEDFYKVITCNEWLTGDHIDAFSRQLAIEFGYELRECWMQMLPQFVDPIPMNKKHIQILHRFDGQYYDSNAAEMTGGHWVCSYYDTNHIYIFDSLNSKVLDIHFKRFLQLLHPYYSFNENPVVFPNVQQQQNSNDCGVFAIAFAVSLVFGESPENLRYEVGLLRKHLLRIYRLNSITPFPSIISNTRLVLKNVTSKVEPTIIDGDTDKSFLEPHTANVIQSNCTSFKLINKNISNNCLKIKADNIMKTFKKVLSKNAEDSTPPTKHSKRETRGILRNSVLSENDKYIILQGLKLNDAHMWQFGTLMSQFSNYVHCDTLKLQQPMSIEPIPVWKKHIQILHSTDANPDLNHWVCSFYNGKEIYIYDSLNMHKLHEDHLTYLKHLYPFYNFNDKAVLFPKVQNQQNSVDCGVFAIAFAVSILYNQKPESIVYDSTLMRRHLLYMFENNKISHFPTISIANGEAHISELENIRKKESAACRKRKYRYEQKLLNAKRCKALPQKHIDISDNVVIERNETIRKNGTDCEMHDLPNEKFQLANSINDIERADCVNTDNEKVESRRIYEDESSNGSDVDSSSYIINDFKAKKAGFRVKRKVISECSYTSDEELTPRSKILEISPTKELEATRLKFYPKGRDPLIKRRTKGTFKNEKKHKLSTKPQDDTSIGNDGDVKLSASNSVHNSDKKSERLSNTNYIFRTKLPVEKYIEKLCDVIQSCRNEKPKSTLVFIDKVTDITTSQSYITVNRNKEETEKICETEDSQNHGEFEELQRIHKTDQLHGDNNLIQNMETGGAFAESQRMRDTIVSPKGNSSENFPENTTKKHESRLMAEKIVKWALHQRNTYIRDLTHLLRLLNKKADDTLKKMPIEKDQRIKILCGDSLHTATSESYFYEMTYSFNLKNIAIVMNSEGKATNILPLIETSDTKKKGTKQWHCNDHCRIKIDNIPDILNNYEILLNKLKNLSGKNISVFCKDMFSEHSTAKHLGHPLSCYVSEKSCSSLFISVEVLSPHFPEVRTLKRLIYRLNHIHKKLFELDVQLECADYEKLCAITDEVVKVAKSFYKDNAEICLNEDEIMEQNHAAFIALTKRSLDTPHFICISCRKLCCKSKGSCISKLRKPIDNKQWTELLNFLDEYHLARTDFICLYCLDKFRHSIGPPTCILNNLYVVKVPKEIVILNDCERMLIQRAKAFQVVQRMGTVAKKNMPNHMKIQKAVGCTFYLPLPTEETLKKICPSTAAISDNQEFYILVNGLPTKANKVWQNLVDLQKVFHALTWLKKNNPHYLEIVLPDEYEKLLDGVNLEDVEFQVDENNKNMNSECDEDDISNDEESLQKNIITDLDSAKPVDDIAGELNDLINDNNKKLNCQEQPNGSPFLTQIRDRETYYQNYTLYPLHNKRITETATNLYQMKKIQEKPLDNRLAILELLCFPELYPSGINGQREERALKLTDQSYVQVRLLSEDSRYRLNQQYIFHLLYETNVRQLNAGIYHALNIINPRHKYTAQGYLEQLKNGELEGNLNTVFERLRNSAAYWKTPRNNLNCMIRYYGPATWFLTLSPSEWLWTDLIQYIRDVNSPHFNKCSENECIARDPVSVSRFLDNKFHGMMDFLLSEDNPIGKISHYFWRREYQGRGTQHWHMVLWVEDAPVMGINSNEDVKEFITKYVTSRLPNKDVSPVLYRRVNTHQRHHHNSYCLRNKKEKSGAILSRCRFGFPRPTTEEFVLREPAISIAGRRQLKTKSRLYDLPRNTEEVVINDYNPTVLCAWEGNMDIQFIGESSTLLTQYCTKYTTKYEVATESDSVHDINSTKPLRKRLWNFAFRSLNHREIGALEAVDTLLSIPLYGTDSHTTIRWVDVNMIRNRKLKPRKDVEDLHPDSTEIFCPSIVDNYYPNRPVALESISLYEFATWYDLVKVVSKNKNAEIHQIGPSLFLKKRSRGYLINHYRHNVNTYPENYFYALLLLYQPWRNTDELKNGFDTYVESFAAKKDVLKEASEYHKNLIDLQRGLENIKEQIEKIESDNKNKEDDNGPNTSSSDDSDVDDDAGKDFRDIAEKVVANNNLPEMIAQLNADQARIFERVKNALRSNDRPLRLCVSGEGGTGKSRLIDTIRCWVKETLKKETVVTAPTGLAAFNVNGLTAHRVFQLPVEHGSIPKYNELSDAMLKVLRLQFKDVILIIIDEISMISNVTLLYINQRLIEIFNTADIEDGWFGGMHMLTFGDFLQLPPVRQDSVYQILASSVHANLMGSLGNIDLWRELFTYDELRINMRQKSDQSYGDLLSRLRVGAVSSDDIKLLQQRLIIINSSLSYDDRLRELCNYINKLPDDTVVLLPTCKQCDLLNFEMLKEIPLEEILLTAEDKIDCPRNVSKKAAEILRKLENDSCNTAGLERVIVIKLGAKVMIRRNIDISLGLVNGTICRVISVSKSLNNTNVDSITVRLSNGHESILERVTVKFQIMNGAYVIRKQFPISLSYGITIHKSQGLSLQNAVVDAGNSIFTRGQTYVALSRVTTLQGLHLINFDPQSMKANVSAIEEYNRLRMMYRSDLPQIDIPHKRWAKVADFPWAIPKHDPILESNDALKSDKTEWIIHGLQNNDGVYSYVNAALQCIFHSSLIRESLLKKKRGPSTILETLLKTYVDNSAAFNSTEIRLFTGGAFSNDYEQDPALFLETLLSKTDDDVKNLVNVQRNCTERCKRCNYAFNNKLDGYTLLAPLHSNGCTILLQKLIDDFYSHWHDYDGFCKQCLMQTEMSRKISIETVNNVVVIKLDLFTNRGEISAAHEKGFLKTLPTSRITLCNKIYTVISGVFTCDDSIQHGHWKSLLRVGKTSAWIAVDDQNIKKVRWPVNSKSAYLLFLQNIKAK